MCGINGVTERNTDLVTRMNAVTAHRGPNGTGVWNDGSVTLGHNRLSILDLSKSANQPFVSEDERYVITYNGELYNFKELKKQLSQFSYRTTGDTEVIVNAYRAWGPTCVERFNGIFAFAIWDKQKRELFLARDHIGVKPLYYHHDGERLLFSSEIKALLEAGVSPVLNHDSFGHYMRLLYTPSPETLLAGISMLEPGHTLTWKKGALMKRQYWVLPAYAPRTDRSRKETRAEILSALDASVARQLVSDVPVGVYLSGGVDSTAVLDAASQVHAHIDTFSIAFELDQDEEVDKFNADAVLAKETAKHYESTHHEFFMKSADVPDLIEEYIWHMDEPVANMTALAQMRLAEHASKDVRVVLGGDGGDELFGGYVRHALARKSLLYWSLPKVVRGIIPGRIARANLDTWAERYSLFISQKDYVLSRILANLPADTTTPFLNEAFFKDSTAHTFLDDMMRADLSSWLTDESLLRSDKMAMAHGLEQRVPLLDLEMVNLSRTIPWTQKTTLFETKKIFKDALKGRVPDNVLNQPKRGWISPGAKWLRRNDVQSYVKDVLSAEYYGPTKELFDWKEIERMYEAHIAREEYHLSPLWSVIVFQVWARTFNVKT